VTNFESATDLLSYTLLIRCGYGLIHVTAYMFCWSCIGSCIAMEPSGLEYVSDCDMIYPIRNVPYI
jgi:hypothetical protein